MTGFDEQVAGVAAAVEILSPTRFAWFGEPSPALPARIERRLGNVDARGHLLQEIEARLYSSFYCPGRATRLLPRGLSPPGGDPALVERLSAANSSTGCWEGGWTVAGREDGQLLLHRLGLVLRAAPEDCLGLPDGDIPDTVVHVRFPKELLRVSPGFYMALAERTLERSRRVMRVYWNLRAAGAVPFVAEASRLVNETGLGARLKVANAGHRYDRCDAGVLYLAKDDAPAAAPLVRALHRALRAHLDPDVPALTRRIAAGVALADDPGQDRSYGQSRCSMIAEALVRAHERGQATLEQRIAAVWERFEEAGIDRATPYLEPGATNAYEIEIDDPAAG